MLLFNIFIFGCFFMTTFGITVPKIAIIGGGIGGTSCAYFLRNLFSDNASVTLFERDVIGGRLQTINIDGDNFEAGGAVIHPRNKYLSEFTKLLGLYPRKSHGSLWGLYNGENFLFKESAWSVVNFAQLFWRYGWDIFHLNHLISSLLDEFSRIYSFQDQGYTFTTVSSLLNAMSSRFPNMTQQTLFNYMKKEGFSDLFISELVQAVMLVNYGQTTDINAFAGAVSLAGAESGLWSVQGGNKMVAVGLLGKSAAKVVSGDVTTIISHEDGDFSLMYRDTTSNKNESLKTEKYDIVVLSAPLITSRINFKNFSKDFSKYYESLHRTVTTFIKGKINSSAFHSTDDTLPDEILINNDSFFINSLSQSWPVTGNKTQGTQNVYKIFSKKPLTADDIRFLFSEVQDIKVKDWLAYPHYTPPEVLPPFLLYPHLYYTNAIEWSASAMEMSAIAGRNVALLIHNMLKDKVDLIDENRNVVHKDEL